jgi:hypothetical protein
MKRRIMRLGVLVAAAPCLAALFVKPAGAAAPDAQGWWWLARSSSVAGQVPPPPNAPSDGLYVASNAAGAEAISAVKFDLGSSAVPGTLTLKLSGSALGTPSLGLCPVTGDWAAAQAGNWESKPAYADSGCATATVSADGQSVTFPTSTLVKDGLLNVAVVPVKDASGNNPVFQVGFAKPGADALAVSQSSTADASAAPASSSAAVDTAPASSSPATSTTPMAVAQPATLPSFSSASAVGAVATAPTPQGAPLLPSTPQLGVDRGMRPLQRVVSVPKKTANRMRNVGIIGLGSLAMIYVKLSSKPAKEPRALVAFGQIVGGSGATEGGEA